MQGDEARVLLGFPRNSWPTVSQIKEAYRRKVWESHPDLFPFDKKTDAESKFKAISEAYTCLLSDPYFMSAQAEFGIDLAIRNRTELDPAGCWQQHGISCLELHQIAVHVLSKSCSYMGVLMTG